MGFNTAFCFAVNDYFQIKCSDAVDSVACRTAINATIFDGFLLLCPNFLIPTRDTSAPVSVKFSVFRVQTNVSDTLKRLINIGFEGLAQWIEDSSVLYVHMMFTCICVVYPSVVMVAIAATSVSKFESLHCERASILYTVIETICLPCVLRQRRSMFVVRE